MLERRHYTLDRLAITGELDLRTPSVVLEEIAEASGLAISGNRLKNAEYRQQVIGALKSIPKSSVEIGSLNTNDLAKIARYVNAEEKQFTEPKLIEALEFLQSFVTSKTLPRSFRVGKQSIKDVCSLNACVCYKFLRLAGYPMDTDMNMIELEQALKLTLLPREQLLEMGWVRLVGVPTPILYKLLQQPYENVRYENSHASLEHSLKRKGIPPPPRNPSDAVIYAALRFHINLVHAHNPVAEYERLVHYGRREWKPKDVGLLTLYVRDSLELDLEETFEKLLPAGVYDSEQLLRLCKNEGIRHVTSGAAHGALHVAMQKYNFYAGKHNATNTDTFDGETVEELPHELCVSYGVKGEKMVVSTYLELAKYYENASDFSNPFLRPGEKSNREDYRTALRKLTWLCYLRRPGESQESGEMRRRLVSALMLLEMKGEASLKKAHEFVLKYRKSVPATQEQIRRAVTLLLEMAMTMRAWKGPSEPYPMESRVVTEAEYPDYEIRVNEAMGRFEGACFALGVMGEELKKLPLLRFRYDNFMPATCAEDGFTIGDRVSIVKSKKTVQSCVRTSSNWFAASAHRYMTLLGMSPGFRMEAMREIH